MDEQVLLRLLISFLAFGFYKCDTIRIDSMEADVDDGGKAFKTKLASCTINPDDMKGFSITAEKGAKGDRGDYGTNGLPGEQGPQGPPGSPGLQGPKGDRGDPGPRGERGKTGAAGVGGAKGVKGDQGKIGEPGKKGERGSIGLSGAPGLDGTCNYICEQPTTPPSPGTAPEGKGGSGTIFEPVDGLCNFKRSKTDKFKEKIWVNPKDRFEVTCMDTSHLTCLQAEKPTVTTKSGMIDYDRPFWLSERPHDYNLTQFYNTHLSRIKWLQQKATKVLQRIRYHCYNSYVSDQLETALLLNGWNDVVIGPNTSDNSPLAYSVPHETHGCTPDAPKDEWRYSDIVIKSNNPNRLPVTDFRIRDVRDVEQQSFWLEFFELCFG